MGKLEAGLDAPTTAHYHRAAAEQIIQCVEDRVYCALLGPRLSGKTVLLNYIESNLARLLGWTCVYIDLQDSRATTQQAFFADLIRLTAQRLAELTRIEIPLPDEKLASSAVFRAFLAESLEIIERDLVLLIDPLEALPTDLVQALLTCLRAAYMDLQTSDHQLTVVVSGALSLATVAVGESSPFRGIARRVFVGDLSESDSQELILEFLAEECINATRPALQCLLSATRGDLYLIRRLTHRSIELVQSRSMSQLRSRDVDRIVSRFLRHEVLEYAPLVDAVRLIEGDPDLMQCILLLLAQESVPRSELPLPLSPDLDPLYLTGVVEKADGDCYRLQNQIYRQFMAEHFTPGQVGHVLALAGRWDAAIDYLEKNLLQGSRASRADLLPATINSMYAAQDLAQAVHFLRRALAVAFSVGESQVWFRPGRADFLHLIGPADNTAQGAAGAGVQVATTADRLEARAFRHQVPLRGQEGDRRVARAIPLKIGGGDPIGVVTIFDDLVSDFTPDQRERELQMVGFLNQAARALYAVSLRRQELALAGRVQASLLPNNPPEIPGWQFAATWKPARETSGDFYDFVALPDGRVGLVMADVVDKGMGAALLMALTRTLIRTYAPQYPGHPERLLEMTNQRFLADIQSGLFVTLFYAELDPATGDLTYCNAGHPPPYLLVPGGSQAALPLTFTGQPLGIAAESVWEPATIKIPSGGLLLLYTDGVPDARNPRGDTFGRERMLDLVQANLGQPAQRVQEALLSRLYAFAGAEPQMDDIALTIAIRD